MGADMDAPGQDDLEIEKNWRFYLGVTCLGLGLLMPIFSLAVLPLDLSTEAKAMIIGILTVGGPEVALVAAAVFLGKDTLNVLKGRMFGFAKRMLPSRPASKFRYYTCLAVMVLAILTWYPYTYLDLPDYLYTQPWLIVPDVLFIIAFLTAGPEFYAKIQALFRWEGRAESTRS